MHRPWPTCDGSDGETPYQRMCSPQRTSSALLLSFDSFFRHDVLLTVLDTRVNPGVYDICYQVEDNDKDAGQHEGNHGRRIVGLDVCRNEKASHPWNAENRLRNGCASNNARYRQCYQRHNRDHCVAQRMLIDDGTLRNTLGTGRTNIVLA